MRPALALVLALSLAASAPLAEAALGLLHGAPVGGLLSESYLVGFGDGQREAALASIQEAGGRAVGVLDDIGVIVVNAPDLAVFRAAVSIAGPVTFLDDNGAIRAAGAQWDGAQWNGAQWNGAEWNGAEWNGLVLSGAEWNLVHGAPLSANDPGRGEQWGLPSTRTPVAWSTSAGTAEAKLCVADSGIDSDHPDLAHNLWRNATGAFGHNFIEPGTPPEDDAGHGTHVAGVAAATVGNSWGVAGVGNVRIMSAKVLGANGTGTEADLASAITWCAKQDADVVLMALTVSDPGPALDRAIEFATARGVTLVASAGNSGGNVSYPARHPSVIGVTAVDSAHAIAPFSSRGDEADLAAPGVEVLSTFVGGTFAYGNGTSQAAAFVAGAAALLRDGNDMSAGKVRAALETTARDLGTAGRDNSYGEGLLDVAAALTASRMS